MRDTLTEANFGPGFVVANQLPGIAYWDRCLYRLRQPSVWLLVRGRPGTAGWLPPMASRRRCVQLSTPRGGLLVISAGKFGTGWPGNQDVRPIFVGRSCARAGVGVSTRSWQSLRNGRALTLPPARL